ncbi:MAG: nucleoside phosphorylase [Lewinellaceae bacterium]|nr:nucleoside phosphorylase [Lewinella sp.]MCB9279203.1 nucleoside phosphorylase [Lewinellaceae bacterium]
MPISPAELILNEHGHIYHLDLHPEQIAPLVFTVGDPQRVPRVSKYFDRIDHRVQKREFITHTGQLGQHRVSVISTGIGTDNIDIALNEIDALFNIDLQKREPKEELTSVSFIRIGTSGSLQGDLPLGSFLASSFGIGMDNLLRYYPFAEDETEREIHGAFTRHSDPLPVDPYVVRGSQVLLELFRDWNRGLTLTCPGFYAPQGRQLRLKSSIDPDTLRKFSEFSFGEHRITNFEMETSALYGMAKLLGHHALSCSVLIANRMDQTFSADPHADEERLIREVLEKIEGRVRG